MNDPLYVRTNDDGFMLLNGNIPESFGQTVLMSHEVADYGTVDTGTWVCYSHMHRSPNGPERNAKSTMMLRQFLTV